MPRKRTPLLSNSDYEKAESLADLSEVFKTRGLILKNEKETYLTALEERWTLTRRFVAKRPDTFPGASLTFNGTRYVVHGIVHGGQIFNRPSTKLRTYLRDEVIGLIANGTVTCVEQYLKDRFFKNLDVKEMNDHTLARRVRPLQMVMGYLAAFGGAFLLPIIFSLSFRLERRRGGRYWGFVAAVKRALEDPMYIPDAQNAFDAIHLPERLEREWLRKHNPTGEVLGSLRSEFIAQYMIRIASEVRAKEIHCIVGASHQPAILYYLRQQLGGAGPDPVRLDAANIGGGHPG